MDDDYQCDPGIDTLPLYPSLVSMKWEQKKKKKPTVTNIKAKVPLLSLLVVNSMDF